jgi:hypothetical protein
MTPTEIKTLIKEEVIKSLIKESLSDLSQLHDGVSTSTEIGKYWFKMISAFESIIDETKDFRSIYSPAVHGPSPNTLDAMRKLQQIVQLLVEMKPIILGMDDIQKRDV